MAAAPPLAETATDLRTALQGVMTAEIAKGSASDTITEKVVAAQSVLTALGQIGSRTPDRPTADATTLALATAIPALTAVGRYALDESPRDGQLASPHCPG